MKLFSSLAIVMIIARSLGLCCFADWARTPHAHILLGAVTAEEMAHHHDHPSPMTDVMPSSPTPMIHGGIVLSVSFGEWQNFLSDFYLLVSPHAQQFSTHLSYMDRLAANDLFTRQRLPFQIDPPPRLANV